MSTPKELPTLFRRDLAKLIQLLKAFLMMNRSGESFRDCLMVGATLSVCSQGCQSATLGYN